MLGFVVQSWLNRNGKGIVSSPPSEKIKPLGVKGIRTISSHFVHKITKCITVGNRPMSLILIKHSGPLNGTIDCVNSAIKRTRSINLLIPVIPLTCCVVLPDPLRVKKHHGPWAVLSCCLLRFASRD